MNPVRGSRARSYENFTSCADVSFPSCHQTSSRRWKVRSVVSAFTSHRFRQPRCPAPRAARRPRTRRE
ncbi:MAG TPA: hypothetical protein VHG91_09015 [Longimicrobium sp.]|nr:hypothetical protein [Longimicrobium sp.]